MAIVRQVATCRRLARERRFPLRNRNQVNYLVEIRVGSVRLEENQYCSGSGSWNDNSGRKITNYEIAVKCVGRDCTVE